jgi:hypothetical protein
MATGSCACMSTRFSAVSVRGVPRKLLQSCFLFSADCKSLMDRNPDCQCPNEQWQIGGSASASADWLQTIWFTSTSKNQQILQIHHVIVYTCCTMYVWAHLRSTLQSSVSQIALHAPVQFCYVQSFSSLPLFSSQILPQISLCKNKIHITSKCRHMHGVLNVDEIKN